mgnify:FL=1
MIEEINCKALKQKIDQKEEIVLLDVREPEECEICNIQPSTLIPLDLLPEKSKKLDKEKNYVIYCKMGGRSAQAGA